MNVDWLNAPGYWISRFVFVRAMAAIYLIAFLAAANQFRPLLGSRGILPIPGFVRAVPFRRSPSVFHLHYSDRFFAAVAWAGVAISALALAGVVDRAPTGVSMAAWAALWALYLSIVNVGQTWYAFGWETLLLEAGFLTIFCGPDGSAPPTLILILLRWLVFRVEFGAGMIKLRGDRCWRDLTCLKYHHETQPLPGPFSWWFHHLPMPLHRVEVAANHVAQLVVPFLLFTPQPVAGGAAAAIILTQLWLMVSGNFSWLNAVTIALALPALGDGILGWLLPVAPPAELADAPAWHDGVVVAVTALVLALSYRPVANLLSPHQVMNTAFDPLRLVNTYGAFGSITRVRREIIVEGTGDAVVTDTTTWQEYEFKGKPGDPRRRPPQVAPYHLRLDWLMWFIPLSPRYGHNWFRPFLRRLLANDRDTLRLLRRNPFADEPPAHVRARIFEYRFTSRAERRATKAWWERVPIGEYVPPIGR
jgi:lipase maturation factor